MLPGHLSEAQRPVLIGVLCVLLADVRASFNSLDNNLGWWANPIYFGDYPAHSR